MDNLKIYLVSQAGFIPQTDLSAITAKLLLAPDFATLKLFWDSFANSTCNWSIGCIIEWLLLSINLKSIVFTGEVNVGIYET